MSETIFCNKLVRDGQHTIIEEDDNCVAAAFTHAYTVEEMERLLVEKLTEEVKEFFEARKSDKPNVPYELADIYEVIKCLADLYGTDLHEFADAKRGEKGSFNDGLVLLWYEMADKE